MVGAAFDHWDSRVGDPELHTHVVVINRAQSEDGVWRTLDSRGTFRATVGHRWTYSMTSPPAPHPKQWNRSATPPTDSDAVESSWKGQQPIKP